jgi:transcriptional regulator of arginine metabolism
VTASLAPAAAAACILPESPVYCMQVSNGTGPAAIRLVALAKGESEGMSPRAPMSKTERQRLIQTVVQQREIATQRELVGALSAMGCEVTQATVSRDIRELGLEKTRDPLGRPRYSVPDGSRRSDPEETLAGLLAQFGHRATAAQNIVVVRSELGTAPAIARALDGIEHPKIVGTLAGDDTCLVIATDGADAAALAEEISALI